MTLTLDEYQALVTVLQRAPLTSAEVLALNAILAKLRPATERDADVQQERNDKADIA